MRLFSASGRNNLFLFSGLLLLISLSASPTGAATPPSGTVVAGQPANWVGDPGFTPTASASCNGPANPACDNYVLSVVDPLTGHSYAVTITLQPDAADDWDLEVYDSTGQLIAGSANSGSALEVVTLNNPSGTYTVAASPFAGATGYTANATMALGGDPLPPGLAQVEFYVYQDPQRHNARNPSLGINWQSEADGPAGPVGPVGADNGGRLMYMSGLDTMRIGLNDCTAPATYLTGDEWEVVTPAFHVLSLDPALSTDPVTGRTQAAQSTGPAVTLGWTDDDGNNWTPGGLAAATGPGFLHLGSGRLAEPLYSLLNGNNPTYNDFAHSVYACSQDIAGATCSVSTDGGTSFGQTTPVWTIATCSARPGRVHISSSSGLAYLPNRACGGQQGFGVTTDNGLTWNVETVPLSGSGEWDPSVSVATDGTIYFGFERGGQPMVSVKATGLSWSTPFDLTGGEIKTTAFPAIVAGDGDRAAFAFFGTTVPGALSGNPALQAEWHLYVSMTFDRGLSWTTRNITAPDPVQRGSICRDTLSCIAGGNLGAYIDIRMDRRGRPVVAFADGCVDGCVTNPFINSYTAIASIARLKSWQGLLAAHDAERFGQPELPLATLTVSGPDVILNWSEPGDGGSPLTGYRITKNNIDLATVGSEFRQFTDIGGQAENAIYSVVAQNSVGQSRVKPGCTAKINEIVVTDPCPPFCGPCDLGGVTVLVDRAGDSVTDQGTGVGPGAYDILQLGISESFAQFGPDRIAFVLEVQNTDTLPPNSVWPVRFKDALGNDRFVRMHTMTGSPVYSYGTGTLTDPVTVPGTPAAPESGIYGNSIVIAVPRAAVGAGIFDTIDQFLVRVGVNLVGATLTPDNMPDSLVPAGSYTLSGSETFCYIDPFPIATDDFAMTNSCTTVDIDVLANDFDSDGNSLQITGVTRPENGQVQIISDASGDRIRYMPNTGFAGVDVFSYTVSNTFGNFDSGDVEVTVNATPDGDGDGIMNSCDNCLVEVNTDQCNTNAGTDNFGNVCDADLDNNGIVNSFDLTILRQNFGQSGENDADLNCNGIVNSFDLTILRQRFGTAPGPTGLSQ